MYQIEMCQFERSYKGENHIREATKKELRDYKTLENVTNAMMSKVISAIPEYKNAKWSID